MISQSHFFPWLEYIKLINQVDVFVLLDDVQLSNSGRTLFKRVQILNEKKNIWLSVPIEKTPTNTDINEVKVANNYDWKTNHINLLRETYRKAKYFKNLNYIIDNFYGEDYEYLIQASRNSTKILLDYFNISKKLKIFDSKDLKIKAKDANDRIFKILTEVKATEYITAKGSINYLDHESLQKNGIETLYPKYEYFIYQQLSKDYNPFVSTLDLIANSEKKIDEIKPTKLINWQTYLKSEIR